MLLEDPPGAVAVQGMVVDHQHTDGFGRLHDLDATPGPDDRMGKNTHAVYGDSPPSVAGMTLSPRRRPVKRRRVNGPGLCPGGFHLKGRNVGMPTRRRRTSRRLVLTALVAGLAVLLPAGSAVAHEGDSDQSRVLVLDALAYLANKPDGYEDNVADKVNDALEAPDTEGVDLTKVDAAKQALDAGDLATVRTQLQDSIEPLTGPVTGEETGTTTMLDPMAGHTDWGVAGVVLAVLSAAALLAGLLLGYRWRRRESLRDLRARITEGSAR
jgi:hypothetical protein